MSTGDLVICARRGMCIHPMAQIRSGPSADPQGAWRGGGALQRGGRPRQHFSSAQLRSAQGTHSPLLQREGGEGTGIGRPPWTVGPGPGPSSFSPSLSYHHPPRPPLKTGLPITCPLCWSHHPHSFAVRKAGRPRPRPSAEDTFNDPALLMKCVRSAVEIQAPDPTCRPAHSSDSSSYRGDESCSAATLAGECRFAQGSWVLNFQPAVAAAIYARFGGAGGLVLLTTLTSLALTIVSIDLPYGPFDFMRYAATDAAHGLGQLEACFWTLSGSRNGGRAHSHIRNHVFDIYKKAAVPKVPSLDDAAAQQPLDEETQGLGTVE
eukprot:gene16979-biopygen18660